MFLSVWLTWNLNRVTPFNQAIPFNQNQNVAFNSVNLKSQFRDPSLTRTLVFFLARSTWDPNPTIPFNKNQNIAFNSVNLKSQFRELSLTRTLVFFFSSVNLRFQSYESWNIIPFLVLVWFAKKMEKNEWYGGELDQSLPLARTNHRLLRKQPSTPKNKPPHNKPAIINNNI